MSWFKIKGDWKELERLGGWLMTPIEAVRSHVPWFKDEPKADIGSGWDSQSGGSKVTNIQDRFKQVQALKSRDQHRREVEQNVYTYVENLTINEYNREYSRKRDPKRERELLPLSKEAPQKQQERDR